MQYFVTGATGFIGSALLKRMAADGLRVRAAVRHQDTELPAGVSMAKVESLGGGGSNVTWGAALAGCSAVVHAAARVHRTRDPAEDPLAEYREINVRGS